MDDTVPPPLEKPDASDDTKTKKKAVGKNAEEAKKEEETEQKEGNEDEKELDEDKEIAEWQKKLKETEEEISKIDAMSNEYEESMAKPSGPVVSNGPDVDKRSVYVGNVEYQTTPDELKEFFTPCGTVNRVTILCNKRTGQPMGYAYIEFKDEDAVTNAVLLDKTEFKGRNLKISEKRTNVRGYGHRRPRYRRRRRYGGYGYRRRHRPYSNRRAVYRPY
ncbi:hypothetical protein AAMO2058_000732900 [Amorphochlora amoebiformis]|uniref:RRM domain-containing protein n=1 Tax=Amorphochlora amoebiformis TaxID=1561963 RepID=A0A6T6WKC2_9EUKA|eukprot:1154311-Amorphochlora_amoeboformis.AAC.2